MHADGVIIKRSESVLAQGSECRLLLGALGEAEQSAKRKAQRCFAPKGVYTVQCTDEIQCLRIDFKKPSPAGEGGPLAVDEVSRK